MYRAMQNVATAVHADVAAAAIASMEHMIGIQMRLTVDLHRLNQNFRGEDFCKAERTTKVQQ